MYKLWFKRLFSTILGLHSFTHRRDPIVIPGAGDGGKSKLLSILAAPFYSPALYEDSNSPTSFLSFGIVRFLDYSPSNDIEGAPHCGFDLHFPND